jgi:hypothetical protein
MARLWIRFAFVPLLLARVTPAKAQSGDTADGGTLLVAILIPSLKYQDLQGFRDVKRADIKAVSAQDAIAATQVPAGMREQMVQSYTESVQQNQARIDSLRINLKSSTWCRYKRCHPAPNNRLVRDALTRVGVEVDQVVALDPRPSGTVVVYYDQSAKRSRLLK